MTQEQKDLLLKDLCARLPYGVVIQEKCVEQDKTFLPNKEGDRLVNIDAHADLLMTNCGSWYYLNEIKPYLFPFSSMTEEQKKELNDITNLDIEIAVSHIKNDTPNYVTSLNRLAWLLKNHFDIYDLIPMGLAIDATGLNIY